MRRDVVLGENVDILSRFGMGLGNSFCAAAFFFIYQNGGAGGDNGGGVEVFKPSVSELSKVFEICC
jgi:hypothetical protein